MRHRSLFLLLLIACLLPLGSSPRTLAASGQSIFGVNSHIASRYPDPSSMANPGGVLAQAETGWVREDVQFSRVQPRQGVFDWQFHDRAFNELVAHNINIIGVLNGPTPGWSVGRGNNDFYAPDPQSYAAFVRATVSRYKDRVHYWEVWNEPDNAFYWKPAPDPVAYANLLKVAYAAIKSVDPSAQVLNAGLVTPEPGVSFLSALAANGAWGSFDILSVHPYTDPKGPEDGQISAAGIGQVKALAERLGNKPIWVTEFGWSTGPSARTSVAFDDETQANYLVRSMALLRAAGADRILWYNLKDSASGERYGMLRFGSGLSDYGSAKPSLSAFRTLNQQVGANDGARMLELGQRDVILDFESFGSWRRGNQPNGTLNQSSAQVHSGAASAELAYSFPTQGNDYVVFSTADGPTIGAGATQFGVWVYGDGSGHALKVWLRDANGEVLQFRLGFVGAAGWQFLSVPITGPVESYNRVSGGGDLRLNLPATLTAIVLDDEPDRSSGSGAIYLDDFTAISGSETYGVRFSKGNGVVDVLWAPDGGQVSMPSDSNQGTVVDRSGASRSVSAANGQFILDVGPSPIYLAHSGGGAQPGPAAPNPQRAADQRCFAETGLCIAGRIREYWEQNGGLPVFGFPTTPLREETIEGHALEVQWFERNRLELHPENPAPYDVLLGRLGNDRLEQQRRNWKTFAQAGAQEGCRWFPETGHNVCGDLLAAWQSNGLELDGQPGTSDGESLALWGMPLSEPQTETLSVGRQYVVQWFERARFELHPENQPPYNVLFGLLGEEVLKR